MTISISVAHNEARLNGTLTFLDTGGGVARIDIYDGTRPANGGTATNKLVEIALSNPAGTITAGTNQLVLASTDLPTIATSGVATWARVITASGAFAFDCDVSATGGAGELQLPSTTLYAGGKTQLASGILG